VIISLKQKKKIQKEEKGYPFTAKKKKYLRELEKRKGRARNQFLFPRFFVKCP